MARAIKAGVVGVNNYSEGDLTMPFGGFRQSLAATPRASAPVTSTGS